MKWKERGMVYMKIINKDYFKYLIKQNKRLLFLIWLIGFIFIPFFTFIYDSAEYWAAFRFSAILTLVYGFVISFLAPIYLFSFIQKKKSTILYFSLPIKKQSLFITTALFSLFATIIPVVMYYIIALLLNYFKYSYMEGNIILSFLIIIIYMIGQQAIVTAIAMLCQNTLDSFIANATYVITPFVAFGCFLIYLSKLADKIMLGHGNYTEEFSQIIHFLSLPYNGLFELTYTVTDNEFYNKMFIIYWLVISIVFIFIAYKLFMKRSLEQSENHTKSIFVYPILITAITFSLMFVMYDSSDIIMIYGCIFVLYLVMYFFSVRKVYFTWKIPAIFIILVVGCIGFANAFNDTKGFGVLSEYPVIENQNEFHLHATSSKNLSYNNEEVNTFNIDSQNKNTVRLIYEFHQNLINNKVVAPVERYDIYTSSDLAESEPIIYVNFYYYDGVKETQREYVIYSKQNIDIFIEMYNKFLQTVESQKEYTCHHDESLFDNN